MSRYRANDEALKRHQNYEQLNGYIDALAIVMSFI